MHFKHCKQIAEHFLLFQEHGYDVYIQFEDYHFVHKTNKLTDTIAKMKILRFTSTEAKLKNCIVSTRKRGNILSLKVSCL